MLTGTRKKQALSLVGYYSDTIGGDYTDFIADLEKSYTKSEYRVWLAHEIMKKLEQLGVSKTDIVQSKDSLRVMTTSKGKQEGEFYTPEIWCKEGREYLKTLLGDLYGKAYIWDASCGTGNLLRTSGYPQDKVFLSTLLPEDIDIVKQSYPDATVFQCDFLNDIDYDNHNEFFSDKLPSKLREILQTNQPLLFFMNPPYFQGKCTSSDIGEYMVSHGLGTAARDKCYHFFYRMLMLKRYYNLTNVFMAIYHPCTLLLSDTCKPLVKELLKDFDFRGGMCFSGNDFSETSFGVQWAVAYTLWSVRVDDSQADMTHFTLDAKVCKGDTVKYLGKRAFHFVDKVIGDWAEDKTFTGYEWYPIARSMLSVTDKVGKMPNNALGWFAGNSSMVGQSTMGTWCMSLPYDSGYAITENNFWRMIPMVVTSIILRSMTVENSVFVGRQVISQPNVNMEGYEQYLIDCIPYFLFDLKAFFASYRGVTFQNEVLDFPNKLFPISADIVKSVVTDENILNDIASHPASNNFILGVLDYCKDKMSEESYNFCAFCMTNLLESLTGTYRKDFEYQNHTVAWDAGFQQVRSIKTFWTDEKEKEYLSLRSKLRDKLYEGLFHYGMLDDIKYS